MRKKFGTFCSLVFVAVLLSACGSGTDTETGITSPVNAQETAADSPANDVANGSTQEPGGEVGSADGGSTQSSPVVSESVETESVETESVEAEAGGSESVDSDTQDDANLVGAQNDGEPAGLDSQFESQEAPGEAGNQRVNIGSAKLLVDLVPNGASYPAKFHRAGDKLYFMTVDTNPLFGRCSRHWGMLSDEDKKIAFNLVATHPETGVVAMNKQVMTVGDFAEEVNAACGGYNASVTNVYEPVWITPATASGQHQFILHFDGRSLGPDQAWVTDGTADNTTQVETGLSDEQTFFEDGKVFFVTADGFSVSDTLSGNRRLLFESDRNWFYGDVKQIDIEYESALGLSSNYGDVTSFEIVSSASPTIASSGTVARRYSSGANSSDQLVFSSADYSVEPPGIAIWIYRDEKIEKLFSMSRSGLRNRKVIAGQDGLIYFTGTRDRLQGAEFNMSFELWSYNPQTEKLLKLSGDDWYALKYNHPVADEGYIFRYLNTPDGLFFLNLKDDTGRELWFTDGTPAGTRQLADINPGIGNSDPQNFYYSGDAVYFSADDGTHGREPWIIPISK